MCVWVCICVVLRFVCCARGDGVPIFILKIGLGPFGIVRCACLGFVDGE